MPPEEKIRKKKSGHIGMPEFPEFEPSPESRIDISDEDFNIFQKMAKTAVNVLNSNKPFTDEEYANVRAMADEEGKEIGDGSAEQKRVRRILAEHEAEMKGERALVAPEVGGIGAGAILKLLLVIVAIFLILGVFGII